jgi:hypothetical protein
MKWKKPRDDYMIGDGFISTVIGELERCNRYLSCGRDCLGQWWSSSSVKSELSLLELRMKNTEYMH